MEEISFLRSIPSLFLEISKSENQLPETSLNESTIDSLSHYEDESIFLSTKKKKYVKKKQEHYINEEEITLKDLINVKNGRNGNNMMKKSLSILKQEKGILSIGAKRKHSNKWSEEETEKFFKTLAIFGTDFSMIAKVLTNRTRAQIKSKFRKEEKLNIVHIDECLKKHNSNKMFKIINSNINNNHRNLTLEKILSESVTLETKRVRFESFSSVDSLDHRIMDEVQNFALAAYKEEELLKL